ncbi:MAG: universal stress protein [Candidatus Marinimicrobia bacterium]|nr:universal stress protein [Candidatus Neomarinimicrobiota bacterium]
MPESQQDPITNNKTVAPEKNRQFLVVVDETAELDTALSYACSRSRSTGGKIALLYVYDVDYDFTHYKYVQELANAEARANADGVLRIFAQRILKETGREPDLYVRKGNRRDQLLKLVKERSELSLLILSSAIGKKPGPLVEAVTGKYAGKIGLPVTVVPGMKD